MDAVVNGRVLRDLRLGRGWDQKTLAAAAGINPSVVSRLERGTQRDVAASVLVALARTLIVPVDALLNAPHDPVVTALPAVTAVVAAVGALPEANQRQVVAIVRAYLTTLPK